MDGGPSGQVGEWQFKVIGMLADDPWYRGLHRHTVSTVQRPSRHANAPTAT
jgi:hypothetical protein